MECPTACPGDDYFVYANPEDRKIYLLPWGLDETFNAADVNVLTEVYTVLAKKCAASSGCRRQFEQRLWVLMDKLEAMNWEGERERILQQIAPHVLQDRRKVYTDLQVEEEQNNMKYFVQERRMSLSVFVPVR